jgi:hypothetical protein
VLLGRMPPSALHAVAWQAARRPSPAPTLLADQALPLPQKFTDEICEFQGKVLKRSGLGPVTYLSPSKHLERLQRLAAALAQPQPSPAQPSPAQPSPAQPSPAQPSPAFWCCSRLSHAGSRPPPTPTPAPAAIKSDPPQLTMEAARWEFEQMVYTAVEDVLKKTGGRRGSRMGPGRLSSAAAACAPGGAGAVRRAVDEQALRAPDPCVPPRPTLSQLDQWLPPPQCTGACLTAAPAQNSLHACTHTRSLFPIYPPHPHNPATHRHQPAPGGHPGVQLLALQPHALPGGAHRQPLWHALQRHRLQPGGHGVQRGRHRPGPGAVDAGADARHLRAGGERARRPAAPPACPRPAPHAPPGARHQAVHAPLLLRGQPALPNTPGQPPEGGGGAASAWVRARLAGACPNLREHVSTVQCMPATSGAPEEARLAHAQPPP